MPASAQGDLNQESRKVVLRMIDAYNARDLEGLVELCDQAVEVRSYFTSAIGGGEYGGHHGIKQFLRDVSEAWEHLTATVGELLALGDGRILALGALRGVGRGSSIELEEEAGWICTLRDGKILRWESYGTRQEARRAAGLA